MAFPRKLVRLWHSLFQCPRLDAELDEELRQYLDGLIEKKLRAGSDPAAARREAMAENGRPGSDPERPQSIGFESAGVMRAE